MVKKMKAFNLLSRVGIRFVEAMVSLIIVLSLLELIGQTMVLYTNFISFLVMNGAHFTPSLYGIMILLDYWFMGSSVMTNSGVWFPLVLILLGIIALKALELDDTSIPSSM